MEKIKKGRIPTNNEAFIGLTIVILVIIGGTTLKAGMQTPLIMGAITAGILASYLGYSWNEIQEGMLEGIESGLVCDVILILVGMLVGTWIIGGTVEALIYYGLKWVSPSIFVPLTCILCAITSLATGTSFGSIATIGLAMMGVGLGLGIPPAITAGAVASGSFFGDKMSPLSDTTNVAPAMAGCDVFEHIRSMMWTTIPAILISLILYTMIGFHYSTTTTINLSNVNIILRYLENNFNLSLLTLIPPLLVIVLSYRKVPAIVTLSISIIFSTIWAMFMQGISLNKVIAATMNGYTTSSGIKMIDKILNRGGISMMVGTVVLVIAATAIGGILKKCNITKVLMDVLLSYVKTPRDLILSTMGACYLIIIITGNMMLGIILPGQAFKDSYAKKDIQNRVLSRTLEDTSTIGTVIVPWGASALYLQAVLGVDLSYIPYTFLSYITPIFSIIFAFTGIAVWRRSDGKALNKIK